MPVGYCALRLLVALLAQVMQIAKEADAAYAELQEAGARREGVVEITVGTDRMHDDLTSLCPDFKANAVATNTGAIEPRIALYRLYLRQPSCCLAAI